MALFIGLSDFYTLTLVLKFSLPLLKVGHNWPVLPYFISCSSFFIFSMFIFDTCHGFSLYSALFDLHPLVNLASVANLPHAFWNEIYYTTH